ncbi:hypothetical protein M9H77_27050 [Catharanthus roseus]|uniref:Uncharacterized protein n=1 Tax=Catharanthus roseus TaxID=4058 RepID=A0ACC0ABE1_CATRO|nr:hypothetical protein M9H77_27050 [Catharanthus roseus]
MTIRNQRFSLLKQTISSTLNQHLIDYPTPSNLSYWWGFDSDWHFLAMHYTPHVELAFNCVEHIMRDVEGGWLLCYMHANGARYVLPWGQMSFWGATIITSLARAIPVEGDTIVTWLWGGFFVDNATLNRASILHLAALHQYRSNNPLGVHSEMDKIASYPYFYVKDLEGWIGCQPVEALFVTIRQISPFSFFLFFTITPILGRVGRGIPNSYTDETDNT